MSELSSSCCEVALDHHLDGLFAEGAVEALRGSVAGAGASHEGVGGRAGVQAQRERRAAQPERRGEHEHEQRSAPGRRAPPASAERSRATVTVRG